MDAMDVLGALIGKKQGSGGIGGAILKSIVEGKRSSSRRPAPQREPQRREPQRRAPEQHRVPEPDFGSRSNRQPPRGAQPLDDLLRDAFGQHSTRRSPQRAPSPPPRREAPPQPVNDQAIVLIRAMVNAAKSDGQLDEREQRAIFEQVGDVSRDTVDFLKQEFARSLNVRDFAWDVPLGLEEQVYSISVMTIDLDENKEARYLQDLARGLRLDPDTCNDIHERFDAPRIF